MGSFSASPSASPPPGPMQAETAAPAQRRPVRLRSAHVINLVGRPDRWQHFTHNVRTKLAWPLTLHRFAAIDTRTWKVTGDEGGASDFAPYLHPEAMAHLARGYRTEHRQLTPGAVGCALSHVALWNLLRSHASWDTMLIFEDDAAWWPKEKMTLPQFEWYLRRIPNDWDILSLGCIPRETIAEHETHLHLGFLHQLHAYVLHRSGAEKLLGNLFPLRDQIDTVVSDRTRDAGLVVYRTGAQFFDQMWRRQPAFGSDCYSELRGTPSREY